MKITESTTRMYVGMTTEQNTEKVAGQSDKTRMYVGGIGVQNPLDARIEEKRATAMEKAKKMIGDVFAAEKAVDDDLAERANRIKESEQIIVDANKELEKIEEEKEKLKEQYGITGEETEEMLPEEYKMQRDELTRYGEPQRQVINEAKKVMNEERKVIAAITVERLKSEPMVGAMEQAEEILESAEEEIAGLITDAVVENLKEKNERSERKAGRGRRKSRTGGGKAPGARGAPGPGGAFRGAGAGTAYIGSGSWRNEAGSG